MWRRQFGQTTYCNKTLLLLLISIIASFADNDNDAKFRRLDSTTATSVTFHLLPHSHCDAGYKKTALGYYQTEVRSILNSVTEWLDTHSQARFVWSEVIFLHWWMEDETVSTKLKDTFRKLVTDERQRLEIVNGGYVMHDETVTRYESQIAQTVLGHDLLLADILESDHVVTTGYQIDSFGMSSFTPTLLHSGGYHVLIGNRIPQPMKEEMKLHQGFQFWWIPNSSTRRVFVNIYQDHYSSPHGFDWEDPTAMEDTPLVTSENVAERADALVETLLETESYYRTSQILVPMGGDFRYQNASLPFENMDAILTFVNANPTRYRNKYGRIVNVTLRYSTVQEYMASLQTELSTPDFFPTLTNSTRFLPYYGRLAHYHNHAETYWSGFYSQYPNLKQTIRVLELLLRCNDILSLSLPHVGNTAVAESVKHTLHSARNARERSRRTIAMLQHHDAITGTAVHFVLHDYIYLAKEALKDLTLSLGTALYYFTPPPPTNNEPLKGEQQTVTESPLIVAQPQPEATRIVGGGPYLAHTALIGGIDDDPPPSIIQVEMGIQSFFHIVNPSPRDAKMSVVHVYVTRSDVALRTYDNDEEGGMFVPSQVTRLNDIGSMVEVFKLSFVAEFVPAFGATTFTLETCFRTTTTIYVPPRGQFCATPSRYITAPEELYSAMGIGYITDGGNTIRIVMNVTSGDISAVIAKNKEYPLHHSLSLINGSLDSVYEFNCPRGPWTSLSSLPASTTALVGLVYSEVSIAYEGWHSIQYRIYNTNNDWMQVDFSSSVLPPSTNLVSTFTTTDLVNSNGTMINVESGYQPMVHTHNFDLPLGANLQPLTSHAWIQDTSRRTLGVSTVDPKGVTSMGKGDLNVVWHRRNGVRYEDWHSGDDRSQSRSSVWLSMDAFEVNHHGESFINDLVVVEVKGMTSMRTTSDKNGERVSSLQREVPLGIKIPFVSRKGNQLRFIFEGSSIIHSESSSTSRYVVPLDDVIKETIVNVSIQSLTFLTIRQNNEDCSIDTNNHQITVSSGALCAVKIWVPTTSDVLFENDSSSCIESTPIALYMYTGLLTASVMLTSMCFVFLRPKQSLLQDQFRQFQRHPWWRPGGRGVHQTVSTIEFQYNDENEEEDESLDNPNNSAYI